MVPDNTFGHVPYLALPMMFLIIIIIGAAIFSQERKKNHEISPTPTAIVRQIPPTCTILDTTDTYVILKCDHSRYTNP